MKKYVIVIGGLSNSGKSTAISYFRELEIPCFSSSELNHQATNSVLEMFNILVPEDREEKRPYCIKVAEDVLVKTFGREVFVNRVVEMIEESEYPIVVTESIGGEEYEKLIKKLEKIDTDVILFPINIRREGERAGIDIRKLLPDVTYFKDYEVQNLSIENNGTLEQFKGVIYDVINSLREVYPAKCMFSPQ
jgi:hypothetical protein